MAQISSHLNILLSSCSFNYTLENVFYSSIEQTPHSILNENHGPKETCRQSGHQEPLDTGQYF